MVQCVCITVCPRVFGRVWEPVPLCGSVQCVCVDVCWCERYCISLVCITAREVLCVCMGVCVWKWVPATLLPSSECGCAEWARLALFDFLLQVGGAWRGGAWMQKSFCIS